MVETKPLQDRLVLDLGIITAGASTSALLADLGAYVIKIESPTYIDPFRMWEGRNLGGEWWNLSPQFKFTNRNKRGLAVDLKRDEGRELFLELVEKCDVVVENFRRGVLESLGLSFQRLLERNPAVILASISSQGESGPLREMVSYGSTLEALGGLAALTGYAGEAPMISGRLVNFPDQVASLFAAGCIVDSLSKQGAGQSGVHLDISQRELTTYLLGEEMLAHLYGLGQSGNDMTERGDGVCNVESTPAQLGRIRPLTRGNQDPSVEFQGCFRGSDGAWVVMSLCDSDHVTAWWHLYSSSSPPEYTAGASRLNETLPETEQVVASWVLERNADQAASVLREHGIPAAVVHDDAPQNLESPYTTSSAFAMTPDGGVVKGLPFQMEGLVLTPTTAPGLGEHNLEVLRDILGMSEERVRDLERMRIIGTAPRDRT